MSEADLKNVGDMLLASLKQSGVAVFKQHGLPTGSDQMAMVKKFRHWVYSCVSINASSVAKTPLRLYATRSTGQQRVGKALGLHIPARTLTTAEVKILRAKPSLQKNMALQTSEEVEEVFVHPFLDLMCSVNPRHNQFDMMELTQTFLDLTGNAYWKMDFNNLGRPSALWILPSQLVTIVPGDDGNVVGSYKLGRGTKKKTLEAEEIIQFRYPNPADPYFYGYSPLTATMPAVNRYDSMDVFETSLLQNNGVPDFVVSYKEALTPDQRKETEMEWNQLASSPFGGKNQRVKVADSEWSITPLGLSPQEMNYLAGRKWTREEIASIYQVPLSMLTVENVNRANAEAGARQHGELAVVPRLARLEQTINQDLIPLYDEPRIFVSFDNPVPADKVFQLKKQESNLKNYVITVNEARSSEGLEPVPWGQEPLAPVNITPLSVVPANTVPLNDETKAVIEAHIMKASVREDRERTGGRNPRMDKAEKQFQQIILKIWKAQEKEAVAAVTKGLGQAIELKATEQTLFKFDQWVKETQELTQPVYNDVFAKGAREGLREIRSSTNIAEFIEQPEVIKATEEMSLKFAEEMNTTVPKQFALRACCGSTGRRDICSDCR